MNLILAICAAVFVGLIVALLAIIVGRKIQEKDPETKYRGQLDAILNQSEEFDGEHDEEEDGPPKRSLVTKWNSAWGKALAEISGQFSPDDSKAGVLVIALWIAIAAILTVLVNIFAGIVFATGLLSGLYLVLKARGAKKDDNIRHQLTGFLFALKANISAGETPERALMKVVDNMPSPLYDELLPAKNQILSNQGFSASMQHLSELTTSEDLRFLCSCMIQATSTGVSLENQIDNILDSVEKKRRTTEEIRQSTKSANMSMYGAGIIIPAGFIGIYILDETARAYWFVEPMSWVALGVAAGISLFGIRQARKFVGKVKDL